MKKTGKVKAIAGLVVLTLVVGTLAFFSKTMSIDNPFSTKKYGGETVEKFTPKKDWEPGGEVTKEVQAKNTGDYNLWVRVKFDEVWKRDGQEITGTALSSVATDAQDSSKKVTSTKFFPTSDETSVVGGSSVYKHLAGVEGKTWVDGGDGYFYYKKTLESGDMTSKLLDYVTLCNDADMGTYTVSEMKYALVDDTMTADQLTDNDYTLSEKDVPAEIPTGKVLYQKKVITLDSSDAGLAGADYTLTITTELLQANEDAATQNDWATYPGKN